MTIKGNISKNSTYLNDLKKAIDEDRKHPRHNGVKMQAHHVISCEGMKRSGLGLKIEKFGYDINVTKNLAFIPCTLQGACYLGVQLHRGNHTASVKQNQDDYDDDSEEDGYHKIVAEMIKDLKPLVFQKCHVDREAQCKKVINKLNNISKQILKRIQENPGAMPLTSIAEHFKHGSKIGCGGVDSVKPKNHGQVPCPTKRSHAGKQGPRQNEEGISYKSNGKYQLETGR